MSESEKKIGNPQPYKEDSEMNGEINLEITYPWSEEDEMALMLENIDLSPIEAFCESQE